MIRATVIVPARDAAATLPRTLAALADQEGAPSFEVVVADLGSADGTAAIAERAGARLVRGGPGAAVAASASALLAFCGSDCFPAPARHPPRRLGRQRARRAPVPGGRRRAGPVGLRAPSADRPGGRGGQVHVTPLAPALERDGDGDRFVPLAAWATGRSASSWAGASATRAITPSARP